ncbi:MAG: hypothetical protein AABX51_01175 [Nanoarchaeota archaeon]
MTDEILDRMAFLKKRLLTLEWDKTQNQLNSGMEFKLVEFRKEFQDLQSKSKEIEKPEQAVLQKIL